MAIRRTASGRPPGFGASLIFQQRQVRQEFADIDRQQHIELLRLAIDNPELIEVLSPATAAGKHARHELYANLMMMYWLAIWELGEIDDEELRAMAAEMFTGDVARLWWGRVGDKWIGTRAKAERRRFVAIIATEHARAESSSQAARLRLQGRPARWIVAGLILGGAAAAMAHRFASRATAG
ncbi:DUF6082 family protein [Actinoplanes sp. Pm04-4]|uniref:DUF6082 family protein n=1 Tax=Paractinoplanes pyxinae TaxID=2997416 RepID=A0ABT4AX26_9ACTN|nr:DUF6082 family protein [Actinoplanes pyxinae]MCY1138417.1 DUF6082 family protein [Actinoplanes pyxinae]